MKGSESVFRVMEKEDLTALEIFQNRREGKFLMRGMREWDDDVDFSTYGTEFTNFNLLTDDYRAIGTERLRAAFRELGLGDYLERIEGLLREGRHEGIEFYHHQRRNIRAAYCKHSITLGLGNRLHTKRAGAMRRHEPDEPEIDVLIDGLNLSRAMSYKNAFGSLPYGGCKTVVQCDPVRLDDLDTIGFLSFIPDRCRAFVGADMGLDEEMVDVIHEKRFTRNFVGGSKSPLASTGTPTAYGELVAIKEACDLVYGSQDLSTRTIALQGLGHVGYPLAEYLVNEGVRLIVTDVDRNKVQKLQQRYSSDSVRSVKPDEIYTVEADIFSPCAMGGIITEERIPHFRCKIIMGAANNQLKATSKEGEIELAKKVVDAGILFIVDWTHNTGGVIAASVLWQLQEEANEEQLKPKIELPCRTNLRSILEEAKQTGRTPTELAYEKVEQMVYAGVR